MPQVYLTFDDGPNEPYTTKVLDLLKKEGIKATFFLCGYNAELYPETVKRIHAEGHTIGNHGYDHSKLSTYLGLPNSVEKTTKVIEALTGERTRLYRMPWGIIMPWLYYYLKVRKYKIIGWSFVARDWELKAEEIEEVVMGKVKDGSIILLHDGSHSLIENDRSETVKALRNIVRRLKEMDYSFSSL